MFGDIEQTLGHVLRRDLVDDRGVVLGWAGAVVTGETLEFARLGGLQDRLLRAVSEPGPQDPQDRLAGVR